MQAQHTIKRLYYFCLLSICFLIFSRLTAAKRFAESQLQQYTAPKKSCIAGKNFLRLKKEEVEWLTFLLALPNAVRFRRSRAHTNPKLDHLFISPKKVGWKCSKKPFHTGGNSFHTGGAELLVLCSECGQCCLEGSAFTLHARYHFLTRPIENALDCLLFQCIECPAAFSSYEKAQQHIVSDHAILSGISHSIRALPTMDQYIAKKIDALRSTSYWITVAS